MDIDLQYIPLKRNSKGNGKKSFSYQKFLLNKYFSIMEIGGQPTANKYTVSLREKLLLNVLLCCLSEGILTLTVQIVSV